MSGRIQALLAAAGVVLLVGCAMLWQSLMVEVPAWKPWQSEAARNNPMLAASLLLQRQHKVTSEPVLSQYLLEHLPAGTLLLAPGATPDPAQAEQLLAWVRRGNTLIMTPMPVGAGKGSDPIGRRFGLGLSYRVHQDSSCRALPKTHATPAVKRPKPPPAAPKVDSEDEDDEEVAPAAADDEEDEQDADSDGLQHLVCVPVPGLPYRLEVRRLYTALQVNGKPPAPPVWRDDFELSVNVFNEGKGKVALMAGSPQDNYFSNKRLGELDHAELLLHLTGLAGERTPVIMVQQLRSQRWPSYLWQHYQPLLLGAAVTLALWLWGATRRFGALLPEPEQERRSLLEHIDASGRWLWQLPGGRARLLQAVRQRTLTLLLRRIPELHPLDDGERARRLARRCHLDESQVRRALYEPVATRAVDFTNQISILQQLRAHYER
jgi:hypothetical protein